MSFKNINKSRCRRRSRAKLDGQARVEPRVQANARLQDAAPQVSKTQILNARFLTGKQIMTFETLAAALIYGRPERVRSPTLLPFF